MGSILSSLVASCACCLTQEACRCCCKACPSCKSSTSARIGYALFFVVFSILGWIMLTHGISHKLAEHSHFTDGLKDAECLHTTPPTCTLSELVGKIAVLRVSFGMFLFFMIFGLLMLGVKSSDDCRSGIQNGFWGFKFVFAGGLVVCCFVMDNSVYDGFETFALIGSFAFILLQLILLVDFAHSWSEVWVGNWEETDDKKWWYALLLCMGGLYILSIVLIGFMYHYDVISGRSCSLNKFFITFNLILSIGVSIVSILPRVQEENPRSGLMQSAVVTVYATYLTWSAVSSEPHDDTSCVSATDASDFEVAQKILGVLLILVSLAYSAIKTGSTISAKSLTAKDEETPVDYSSPDGGADDEHHVYDDEEESVAYNYSITHILLAFASLYVGMVLASWPSLSSTSGSALNVGTAWSSVWVKIVSSWMVYLLYLWTLIAPIVLPDRDFS